MRLFQTDRDLSSSSNGADTALPEGEQSSALERYRMYGRFYERYWAKLFGMTQADMTRLASQMSESGKTMTLTDLARDVIRARLQTGPELRSGPAPNDGLQSLIVRPWDPGAGWREGDRAIVIVASPSQGRAYAPRVGEVIHVKEGRLVIAIDGMATSQVFELGPGGYGPETAAAEAEMLGIGQRLDEDAQIDFVLWRYGPRVVTALLHALHADSRFVALEGRWFLRELALCPSESMLARLSTTMFQRNCGSVRLDDVLAMLSMNAISQEAARFGLAQALSERTDLFENIGSATYPRWRLAGPPPLAFTAKHAVYDPETYVVLCVPGETLSPQAAQRLWRAGLLHTALDDVAEQGTSARGLPTPDAASSPAKTQPNLAPEAPATRAPSESPDLGLWQRWLRFSRG